MCEVLTRRSLLHAAGATGLVASTAGLPRSAAGPVAAPSEPAVTFVSMPDFMNGDVADLSVLPTWDNGLNSVNDSWLAAIEKCLGVVGSFSPDAVLVAGDLVDGHWNIDTDGRALFGEVDQQVNPESIARCTSAIRVAGDLHYGFYADRFESAGLLSRFHPALGDHEILDDRAGPLNERWSPSGITHGLPDNRYYLVDTSKSVWADHFTRPGGVPRYARRPAGAATEWTAYAVDFGNAMTLITVDMFMKTSAGVRLGVFGAQLQWLRDEIRRAKRRGHVVVVQGHIPVITPTRWMASGRLHVPEGRHSRFYRTLEREGADLFLCGEVHDSTVVQRGRSAPVQVSHGCIFHYAFSFLVGRVYLDGRIVLDLYEMLIERASIEKNLWESSSTRNQRTFIEYGEPVHRGRLVQRRNTVLSGTGKLGVYHPLNDHYRLTGNLGTVLV
jgi:3',5'-cyclic AMP phosphodiesterase CpdA